MLTTEQLIHGIFDELGHGHTDIVTCMEVAEMIAGLSGYDRPSADEVLAAMQTYRCPDGRRLQFVLLPRGSSSPSPAEPGFPAC
jgi:hypothetical protein